MVRAIAVFVFSAAALVAAQRPHPRLELDGKLLKEIRALREAGDPVWTRLVRWASAAQRNENSAVLSSSLIFAVTGDRAHFERAWDVVRKKVYRNGSDRAGGLFPLVDLYGGNHHDAAYQGGVLVGVVAHFYDWTHAAIPEDRRRDIVEWLNAATRFIHIDNSDGHLYLRNDGASVTQGVAAAAYATLGENPEGETLMGWFRERWRETLAGLDIMGKGGATGEGTAYGTSPTGSGFITAANIAYYAAGEDLFAGHPWFEQRLFYDTFAAYPGTIGGPSAQVAFPGAPMVEQASIGGDGRRAASWHNRDTRRNGLVLARRFADTEAAAAWNWVFRQPEVDRAWEESEAIYDVLYWSPRPRLVKPKRLSFFDPSMGFVFIRSGWDSADDTWISFWAGPHIDTHQHLDQGAFTVFKRRDLAPKTGHYDSVYYPHHLAWYTRTVSSNGLLIGDPREIFRGFISSMGCDENGKVLRTMSPAKWPGCIPNDGGQRTMHPRSMAVANAKQFEQFRDISDVARVTAFRDDGRAVTVAADITNAYNNPRHTTPGNRPKVNRVWRRLVYLREPDVLLVADTVESTEAQFEKKWLLHALDRIEIEGSAKQIDAGESVYENGREARVVVDDSSPSDRHQATFDLRRGYAALLVKTVLPERVRYRKIGGREPAESIHADLYQPNRNAGHFHRHVKDFWVKDFSEGVIPNHVSYNWAPERPNESAAEAYMPVYGPGYGRWRLEVEPAEQAKTDHFLHVLAPTLDRAAAFPEVRAIRRVGSFGAEMTWRGRTYRVTFRSEALEPPAVEIAGLR